MLDRIFKGTSALILLSLFPVTSLVRAGVGPSKIDHWNMEEGAGTVTADIVDGDDATFDPAGAGGPQWNRSVIPPFDFSTAVIDFDGTGDRLVAAGYKAPLIGGTADRSMSAWIKTRTNNPANKNLGILAYGQDAGGEKWIFRVQSGNGQAGAIRVEVNGGYIVGNKVVTDGKWHHVACTFANDGTPNVNDVKLYVDGVLDASVVGGPAPSAVLARAINTDTGAGGIELRIGDDHSNRKWNGWLDEVCIFTGELSALDVAGLAALSPNREIVWDDGNPDDVTPIAAGQGDADQNWISPKNWRFDNTGNAVPPNDTQPRPQDRANIAYDSGVNQDGAGGATPGPGSGGGVVINAGDTIQVSSIRVGTNPGLGYGGNGRLEMNGGLLTVFDDDGTGSGDGQGNNFILGADGERSGVFLLNDGTVEMERRGSDNGASALIIGASNGEGYFEMRGGVFNADAGGIRLAEAAASQGTLRFIDGTINASGGNFEVANFGAGVVIMDGGALNQTSNNIIVGQNSASNARFTLNGGTVVIQDLLRIANRGTGLVEINDGTMRVGTILDLANNNANDSDATLIVNGGQLFVGDRVASDMKIGNENRATSTSRVEILGGLVDITRSIRIADNEVNSSGVLIVGDGTSMPTVNLNTGNTGNFETADNGKGTFTFKSGVINAANSNWITGQAVNSEATVIIGGESATATLNYDGGDGNRDWNTNGGHGMVDVLANGIVNIGRHMNLGNNGDADAGLELTIDGGEVNLGTGGAAPRGNLVFRNNGPKDQVDLLDGMLSSNGGTINLDDAPDSAFNFAGGILANFRTFTNGRLIQDGGILVIGLGPGLMTCNAGYTGNGGVLDIEIDGAAPGGGHDQLIVNGTVDLAGVALDVVPGVIPMPAQTFTIVNNDGGDAVTGTFAGLPDEAEFTAGNGVFRIDYQGGDGNDVELTFIAPAPDCGASPEFERDALQGLTIPESMLLANVTPGVPGALSVVSAGPAASGQATVFLAAGFVFYQPDSGFTGADTFDFEVQEDGGGSVTCTATVLIKDDPSPSQNIVSAVIGGGQAVITFQGIPGRTYQVQFTENMLPYNWQPVTGSPITAGPDGLFTMTHSIVFPAGELYRSVFP